MPAPAKTTDAAVVAAARRLLEAEGPAGVTMQAVAAAVGVRAPSLYKRFADRAALLAALDAAIVAEFAAALDAPPGDDAVADVAAMAARYRAFAHTTPHGYQLMFSAEVPWTEAVAARRRAAAAPALAAVARLTGPERALDATRALTAYLHGFASMQASGAFRFGGDPEPAFALGLSALLARFAGEAVSKRRRPAPPPA